MVRCVAVAAGLGALAVALAARLALAAPAAGDDPCPEPNDTFQEACYLGPGADALGFIVRPDDVDAYRFEVLDAGASVHLALADRPLPYRVHLANWNGDVIADGPDGSLDATLPLPGSYFVFVDSGDGEYAEGVPYRLSLGVSYAQTPPTVLYAREFRPGSDQSAVTPNPSAQIEETGGRVAIKMTQSGTEDNPTTAGTQVTPAFGDFTLILDSRIEGGAGDGGYSVIFREASGQDFYRFQVRPKASQAQLVKVVKGLRYELTDWVHTDALDANGGVNRTIITCVGSAIDVSVNGQPVLSVTDDTFPQGRVAVTATTWADPITVYFDNLLMTTPASS